MQRMLETGPTLPPQAMAVLPQFLISESTDGQSSSDRFVRLNGVNVQFVATLSCCSFVEL